eukprot:7922166-Pyramimonas_sp.AAC.1
MELPRSKAGHLGRRLRTTSRAAGASSYFIVCFVIGVSESKKASATALHGRCLAIYQHRRKGTCALGIARVLWS